MHMPPYFTKRKKNDSACISQAMHIHTTLLSHAQVQLSRCSIKTYLYKKHTQPCSVRINFYSKDYLYKNTHTMVCMSVCREHAKISERPHLHICLAMILPFIKQVLLDQQQQGNCCSSNQSCTTDLRLMKQKEENGGVGGG